MKVLEEKPVKLSPGENVCPGEGAYPTPLGWAGYVQGATSRLQLQRALGEVSVRVAVYSMPGVRVPPGMVIAQGWEERRPVVEVGVEGEKVREMGVEGVVEGGGYAAATGAGKSPVRVRVRDPGVRV